MEDEAEIEGRAVMAGMDGRAEGRRLPALGGHGLAVSVLPGVFVQSSVNCDSALDGLGPELRPLVAEHGDERLPAGGVFLHHLGDASGVWRVGGREGKGLVEAVAEARGLLEGEGVLRCEGAEDAASRRHLGVSPVPAFLSEGEEPPHRLGGRSVEQAIVFVEQGVDVEIGVPVELAGHIEVQVLHGREIHPRLGRAAVHPAFGFDDLAAEMEPVEPPDVLLGRVDEDDRQVPPGKPCVQIVVPEEERIVRQPPPAGDPLSHGLRIGWRRHGAPVGAEHHGDFRVELAEAFRRIRVRLIGQAADVFVRIVLRDGGGHLVDEIPDVVGEFAGFAFLRLDLRLAGRAFAAAEKSVAGDDGEVVMLRRIAEISLDVVGHGLDDARRVQAEVSAADDGAFVRVVALPVDEGEVFGMRVLVGGDEEHEGVVDLDGHAGAESDPAEPERVLGTPLEMAEIRISVEELGVIRFVHVGRHVHIAGRDDGSEVAGPVEADAGVSLKEMVGAEQRPGLAERPDAQIGAVDLVQGVPEAPDGFSLVAPGDDQIAILGDDAVPLVREGVGELRAFADQNVPAAGGRLRRDLQMVARRLLQKSLEFGRCEPGGRCGVIGDDNPGEGASAECDGGRQTRRNGEQEKRKRDNGVFHGRFPLIIDDSLSLCAGSVSATNGVFGFRLSGADGAAALEQGEQPACQRLAGLQGAVAPRLRIQPQLRLVA